VRYSHGGYFLEAAGLQLFGPDDVAIWRIRGISGSLATILAVILFEQVSSIKHKIARHI
jgi:hypothetical protein